MPFHLDPLKNVLLLHLERTPKIFPIGYPQINAPKFLLLSLKSFVARKEACGYAKVIHKKRKSIDG